MNAREIERLAAQEAAARRAKSKRLDAKAELQRLIQDVGTRLTHHHMHPSSPEPVKRQLRPGTRAEVQELCEALRSKLGKHARAESDTSEAHDDAQPTSNEPEFGSGPCRLSVLI